MRPPYEGSRFYQDVDKYNALRRALGATSIELTPSPYVFIISICPVDMKVFARFDEIPSMTLQDIKKTVFALVESH